jgi:hypothetical protein
MSDETVTSFREGHAACPFVAFEDDRDHRSESPDYRHRCFASPDPEPRALPHQERFCLSAAFAACPIFLDWARAEAAGVADKSAAATGAGAGAAEEAPARSPIKVASETAVSLSGRGRTTPAESTPVTARASDPGSGLWGFEGAPRRTVASVTAAPKSDGPSSTPAYSMARRHPTRPDWENPPRLDNFPRLRARDDRNNNQPLLLAALAVSAFLVLVILYPVLTSNSGGGVGPSASGSGLAGGPSSSVLLDSPSPTPTAQRTLEVYTIKKTDRTLSQIALDHGISLTTLEAANPLDTFPSHNYNIIWPGMQIYMPWQSWVPSPTPSPTASPTPLFVPTPTPTL